MNTLQSTDTGFDAEWRQLALAGLDDEGRALVERALTWSLPQYGQINAGESMAAHAAGTVSILAKLHTDATTRAAALIANTAPARDPNTLRSLTDTLANEFGHDVARLVRGYRALLRVSVAARESGESQKSDDAPQTEKLRKMMLAMAADLRIVLMRLASRLQTLRWHASAKQPPERPLARETLDLYSPLANRLGVWQIKWELEDLAFRFLEPVRYKEIAALLDDKRAGREAYIASVIKHIQETLQEHGIKAEVTGRAKHIYSIWNKMRTKGLEFADLHDIHALRIVVDDERTCYAVLALINQNYQVVQEEFDDYIARPKPNGYRSLHTVVVDGVHRPFEIQIRTHEMHEFAEFGVAAHWRYKEAGAKGGEERADSEYDRRLAWMRQLLAWGNDQISGAEPAIDADHAKLGEDDRIYVLTPQARVVDLPRGATPVDFAYHVHTDLGHRCRGARVDGHIVSLHTPLRTGQTVEIIAAKAGGPSRDWLNPQHGYLVSPRSRAKVRQWFNAVEVQQRIAQGQATLEKDLQRRGRTAVNLEQLAQEAGFARADDLYIALAKDEFSLRQFDAIFARLDNPDAEPDANERDLVLTQRSRPDSTERGARSGVLVVGVDSLMTQLARCCRPAPPDAIGGFVTRGRGVSVHRSDCHNFGALARRHPERIIEVSWGDTQETLYPVDVHVTAHDRPGLLRDLSEVFARLKLNVTGVNTLSRQSLARMVFTLEVGSGQELTKALGVLEGVDGVLKAQRR